MFGDPGEVGLEFGSLAQGLGGGEALGEGGVGVGGVDGLVAGFAGGDAVLGLAAFLFGEQMMERDEAAGNVAATEGAGDRFGDGGCEGDRIAGAAGHGGF